jgi:5-formyltetrahydrofolate cyclo-ligase
MTPKDISAAKEGIRRRAWDRLEAAGVVPPGVHGYIPDFDGTDRAAERLAELPLWKTARVVFATPDRAQRPVRARALAEGKIVYMAVPRLLEDPPFVLLDPGVVGNPPTAATHQIATRIGRRVSPDQMQPIDLAVCGSVVVNRRGQRLGKGGGYLDREVIEITKGRQKIFPIATTVHQLQVLDHPLPTTQKDTLIDLIVTPSETHVVHEA